MGGAGEARGNEKKRATAFTMLFSATTINGNVPSGTVISSSQLAKVSTVTFWPSLAIAVWQVDGPYFLGIAALLWDSGSDPTIPKSGVTHSLEVPVTFILPRKGDSKVDQG